MFIVNMHENNCLLFSSSHSVDKMCTLHWTSPPQHFIFFTLLNKVQVTTFVVLSENIIILWSPALRLVLRLLLQGVRGRILRGREGDEGGGGGGREGGSEPWVRQQCGLVCLVRQNGTNNNNNINNIVVYHDISSFIRSLFFYIGSLPASWSLFSHAVEPDRGAVVCSDL